MSDENAQTEVQDDPYIKIPMVDIENFKLIRVDEDFEIVPTAFWCSSRHDLDEIRTMEFKFDIRPDVLVLTYKASPSFDRVHVTLQGWNRLPTN